MSEFHNEIIEKFKPNHTVFQLASPYKYKDEWKRDHILVESISQPYLDSLPNEYGGFKVEKIRLESPKLGLDTIKVIKHNGEYYGEYHSTYKCKLSGSIDFEPYLNERIEVVYELRLFPSSYNNEKYTVYAHKPQHMTIPTELKDDTVDLDLRTILGLDGSTDWYFTVYGDCCGVYNIKAKNLIKFLEENKERLI